MVNKRDTALGIGYYLGGLAVTLSSPELTITQRVGVFTLLAVVVFAIEAGRRIRRRKKAEQLGREPQVEVLLDSLIERYRTEHGMDGHLRSNAMVPVESRPILSNIHTYFSTRDLQFKDHTGGYAEGELAQSYELGQGCCGLAWERSRPIIYGEGRKEEIEERMTEEQLNNTGDVESIISVPVYDGERQPDNLVCVVNIDSEDILSETCFTDERVRSDTERFADVIAATVEEDYHA